MTFVYYLPTKFLQQMGMSHDMKSEVMPHDENVSHGSETLVSTTPTTTDHMMPDGTMTESSSGNGHAGHAPSMYQEENDIKEGLTINLNINPVPVSTGVSTKLDFFVNQKPGNVPVPVSSLQLNHTKLMHVIGVRSDMNEFFHIHPQATDASGVLSVDHTFNKPGSYKIWSEITKDSVDHIVGHPELIAQGADVKEDKQVSFAREVVVSGYQAVLKTKEPVVKNNSTYLSFDIHTDKGAEVDVEDYFGVPMHLTIIKDDWKVFLHTHPGEHSVQHGFINLINRADAHEEDSETTAPADTTSDQTLDFDVIFPEAGLYKAFVQFRPKGIALPADEALTAEFWIEVKEKAPFPVSQWWGLLLVSILLMAGLSWLVNGYLKVKAEDVKVRK